MAKAAVVPTELLPLERAFFQDMGDDLNDLGRSVSRLFRASSEPPERELVTPLSDSQISRHFRARGKRIPSSR